MKGCRPLTNDEIAGVKNSFTSRYELRNKALFTLGLRSGYRIAELLAIRVGDVWKDGHVIDRVHVARRHMKRQVEGRTVPLVGFIINGAADPVYQGDKHWQLNEYTYSLSALYFPLGHIGEGLYLKGGLGYSLPISDTLRPIIGASYSLRMINSGDSFIAQGNYEAYSLDVGLLF